MSVSDHQSPLSLEDQCYLYLILHLEEFLSEDLSILPLRVRERLLVNLPAADICKLEETIVVQGVCMNAVWKKVGQRQIKHYYDYVCKSTLEALQRDEGYRDHFHEVVSHSLVWEDYLGIRLPFLLYTVMECLGISDWQSRKVVPIQIDIRYGDIAVLPPRYDQYFNSSSDSVQMLFSCFKMLPRKLTTGNYKAQYACGDETTLRLLLKEVEEFHIRSYGTLSETLCGLLRKDTPRMSVANSLIQCSGSKLNCIHVLLQYSSYSQDDQKRRYGWVGKIPLCGNVPQENESLPYSTFIMVKKLSVSMQYILDEHLNALLKDIAQAVKYQLSLEELLIEVPGHGNGYEKLPNSWTTDLLSTLTEFVCRKTFCRFVFRLLAPLSTQDTASVLDVELYDKLIAPFSCAPPQQKRQVIEIHQLNIISKEEVIKVPLRSSRQSTTAPQWRSVSFHNCSYVSESFLKRIQSLDIELQVNTPRE